MTTTDLITVTDINSNPISNVSVQIEAYNGVVYWSGVTDIQGKVSLYNVTFGSQTIYIFKVGFQPIKDVIVNLIGHPVMNFSFQLVPISDTAEEEQSIVKDHSNNAGSLLLLLGFFIVVGVLVGVKK